MRIVSIINQKGGCGKTTVSINLASALAGIGKRTLLVDMDPQSHCAVGLAVPEEQIEQSIYDVLISKGRGESLRLTEILWQISDGFELAPSSIDLAAFDQQMSGITDRENCLKSVLETVSGDYDYVVVDCPPSVGLLTFNAIRASTDVIVPVDMGYFSLHGLSKQLETLNVLSEQCTRKFNVMVLPSMYDIRTKMGREILAELRKHFSGKMFKTVVNFNTKLKEAASLGQPISEYDPVSKGRKDFHALAQELVGTDTQMHRTKLVNSLQDRLDAISASAEELLATVEKPKPTREQQRVMSPAAPAIAAPAPTFAPPITTPATAPQIAPEPVTATNTVAAQPVAEKKTLDMKIAEFYGTRQIGDAMMFVTLYPRAKSVQIAGDFNNWQPEKTQLNKVGANGVWQIKLPMTRGKYRYRLVVDGQWQQDPYNEMTEMNPFGEMNSVLYVN
ncbi:MAG: AAA family ATPase [Sedimentisphaerales bacterium]|nr:AAA family ATPase [Sedimentisphaerales bacterium]